MKVLAFVALGSKHRPVHQIVEIWLTGPPSRLVIERAIEFRFTALFDLLGWTDKDGDWRIKESERVVIHYH